jgi:SAM-dependent MidA family methyltransferase
MSLPVPSPEALAHSSRLTDHIRHEVAASGGWISFARYMELALYAPGLGYYAAGSRKFGAAGDFITAPEMTPRFAQTLAVQVKEILEQTQPEIIEVGAGSGRLAADLLLALADAGTPPARYGILELSAELAVRQRETIKRLAPQWLDRVEWLNALPDRFSGVVLGNEVLDAMPAHLVVWDNDEVCERGVEMHDEGNAAFRFADRPAAGALLAQAAAVADSCKATLGDAGRYLSEISLANRAWTAEWAQRLEAGAMILIDYGFPRHEYYHPQRATGTLMCHYRHHAHGDPFYLPGLQDITVHVDFTAIAEAGFDAGLSVLGYTPQSHFLLNCGILDLLSAKEPADTSARLRDSNPVQKLLSPAEMGELFKVIALGKGVREPLRGFIHGDRLASL